MLHLPSCKRAAECNSVLRQSVCLGRYITVLTSLMYDPHADRHIHRENIKCQQNFALKNTFEMENYVTVARMRNIVNVYNVVVGGN